MMSKTNFKQGWFQPRFPEKWILAESSITKGKGIRYMSSWERRIFNFLDLNEGIIKIASEPFPIKYISPKDQKYHRYYPDILISTVNGKKFLLEIKPYDQTKPPRRPRNMQNQKSHDNYVKAWETYNINQAKWAAAREFCELHDLEFKIITERELQL